MLRAARGTQTSYKRQNADSATRALLLIACAVLAKIVDPRGKIRYFREFMPRISARRARANIGRLSALGLSQMQTRYKAKRCFREFMPRISARRARVR